MLVLQGLVYNTEIIQASCPHVMGLITPYFSGKKIENLQKHSMMLFTRLSLEVITYYA